jgi:hypothetical protein
MARNADMARFLERLSPSLAASFSAEQLAVIELHFSMRNRTAHIVDWRRQFGIGRLRGYVVVLAGRARAGE